jgi:hypothetical protein
MRLPMAVFLILSGFYLLTMSGHTYSSDEETMLAVTRGLIERGDVAVVVEDGAPVSALCPGRDGRVYSPYGVLPSLLAIPLHLPGTLIAPSGLQADYASSTPMQFLPPSTPVSILSPVPRWSGTGAC